MSMRKITENFHRLLEAARNLSKFHTSGNMTRA